MDTNVSFGSLNGHAVGIIMKEAARRASHVIRASRFSFDAKAKVGYDGGDDLVTSADAAAQAVYVRLLRECLPRVGIVAEEDALSVPCTLADDTYFTVDPLDGTKAYGRRQSHGVGTMCSLVRNGTVIAAFVGDVFANEVFGFRPGSPHVHRISDLDHASRLSIDAERPLTGQYALLRDHPDKLGERLRGMVACDSPAFKGIEVTGGSIGVSMARLWKGEVGAAVLNRGHQTPWDLCPIVGISKALGFVFLRAERDELTPYEPLIVREVRSTPHDSVVVHESRVDEARTAYRHA